MIHSASIHSASIVAPVPRRRPVGVVGVALLAVLALGLGIVGPGVADAQETPRPRSPVSGDPTSGAPTAGQSEGSRLTVYAFGFQYQSAEEALLLVRPLLSPRGSVEIQPGENTLVLRDSLAALGRILPVLRRFDVPPRDLAIDVMIVRAATRAAPTEIRRPVPEPLATRLRSMLRWDDYRLLAEASLVGVEGQEVVYELGDGFGLDFRVGAVLEGRMLRLRDFELWRLEVEGDTARRETLLSATLNLRRDRPTHLILAKDEGSDHALVLVLDWRPAERRERPRGGN